MSFEHTGKYFTNMEEEAAVCVRIVGGDWETLTIPTYFSGNDWTFVNSGDIDLSDYVGKEIQIGFRYTSTSTSAGTWEVKNVEVCEKTVGGGEPDEPEGATTVTFDFTSADELTALGVVLPEAGNGTDISGMALVKDEVTMTATDGGTTTRVWNSSGKLDLRVYKNGGSLTLSVPEGNKITKVAFGGSNLLNFTSSVGTYASSEWNGSSQTVTFSASGTVNVKTISVTYVSGEGETPTIQPRNLAFSAATATATVGQPFTAPTLLGVTTDVEYTSSNTAVATVNAETGAVTLVGAGTTTITASAPVTAEYEAGEASYTLTVAAAVVDDTDYSGTYAIVAYRNNEALYYYLTNVETTTSTKRLTAVAAGNALPEDGVTVNGDKLWKVAKSGSTYTVQSVASSKYVAWVSGNSAIMSDEGIVFNLEENEGTFHFVYTGSEKARYLSLNNQTGNDYFAMYEGTISDLYLIPATEGEEAVPELTGITVNATKTTFTVGDEFAFEGTVTANYSNSTTKDVTESAAFSGYNMSEEGTQTITVTYEGKTATYDITVNPAQSGVEAKITFGKDNVVISSASVTGSDSQNNQWTITTTGTDSFTSNTNYYQVGSSKKPASSITFTTTLPSTVLVSDVEAKFGGFSGTSGDITLKVGDTSVGTGKLNATSDVTVKSTSTANGNKVTVTVTNIAKGVKCYYISVRYNN